MFKAAVAAFLAAVALGAAAAPNHPIKVVYHMNEGVERAPLAIRNIGNHLTAEPSAKIVQVAYANGINVLMKEAKDANGNPFEVAVQGLGSKGLEFRVCEFTLTQRKIDKKQLIDEVGAFRRGRSGAPAIARGLRV